MNTWQVGGDELVRATLNLSGVSERLRDWQLPITASFMARNLNRIGRLTLQELPDDPESRKPFTYYQHPAGSIVIAPYQDEAGVTRWQFTPATVDQAQRLFDALRTVPVAYENVENTRADSPFFVLRSVAHDLSPSLTAKAAGAEIWQWAALGGLLLVLPAMVHFVARPLEPRLAAALHMGLARLRSRYTIALRLLITGGLWLLASAVLGLPERLSGPVDAVGRLLVIAGLAWLLFQAIGRVADLFHVYTRRTPSPMDDVAVSLLAGLAKVLLVVVTAVAVADVFGMPYETVLAGLGVGGLAFAIASRDLVANLFGSAIIASDRPFKRGDFVTVGGIQGTVEHVGLRSTRLRPLDDTTVMIPNSTIATDRVINITRWRQIRMLETIHIDHDSSVEDLRRLRERLREELLADDMVAKEMVRVGVDTLSLYAVEFQISCYIRTTSYDEFLYQKHRLLTHLLETIEAEGVRRAVIRRE
jgi:small-conductance mechanosensitive channel